uniref:(California timema) hypothetical protein n=1 Tax=Timema californicum TaxID=61474 RepID=A0A7R9JAN1_TIMCA|nr:unnamed protein product [Timema californicum]
MGGLDPVGGAAGAGPGIIVDHQGYADISCRRNEMVSSLVLMVSPRSSSGQTEIDCYSFRDRKAEAAGRSLVYYSLGYRNRTSKRVTQDKVGKVIKWWGYFLSSSRGLGTTSSTLVGAIDVPKPCSDKRDVTTGLGGSHQPPIE